MDLANWINEVRLLIQPGNVIMASERFGEPTWEVASLFPVQGKWSESDYLALETNQLVELSNGCLEVLPRPTWLHQAIHDLLLDQLKAWNKVHQLGKVLYAPLPTKLFPGTYREPDILLVPPPPPGRLPSYPTVVRFVLEIVSEGGEAHRRDYIAKRADYAKAGIPEYWIVDPIDKAVTVLHLNGAEYTLHGRFEQNQVATSATLEGFSVNCGEIWDLELQK